MLTDYAPYISASPAVKTVNASLARVGTASSSVESPYIRESMEGYRRSVALCLNRNLVPPAQLRWTKTNTAAKAAKRPPYLRSELDASL